MKKYSDLEFLRLSRGQKFLYKLQRFFVGIPLALWGLLCAIGNFFKALGRGIRDECKDIFATFREGDWKTRLSFLLMGFGSIARGQWLRGVMFFLFEVVFLFYMVTTGSYWLGLLPTLGRVGPHE
ncbi:MAG: hypothetical protein ACSW8F_03775, partial [bacterium]